MLDDDDLTNTTDNSDNTDNSDISEESDDSDETHKLHHVNTTRDSDEEEHQFEGDDASPSVKGEEDVFSGDTPEGIPADIDDELAKVGLDNDEDGVKPLGVDDDID